MKSIIDYNRAAKTGRENADEKTGKWLKVEWVRGPKYGKLASTNKADNAPERFSM